MSLSIRNTSRSPLIAPERPEHASTSMLQAGTSLTKAHPEVSVAGVGRTTGEGLSSSMLPRWTMGQLAAARRTVSCA